MTGARAIAISRHADPNEAAVLRRLHRPAASPPRRRRAKKAPAPVPPPASVWKPIDYRGPNAHGERRWRCDNQHPNQNSKPIANSTFSGRKALQQAIRRHMARYHPEQDAETEARRAP